MARERGGARDPRTCAGDCERASRQGRCTDPSPRPEADLTSTPIPPTAGKLQCAVSECCRSAGGRCLFRHGARVRPDRRMPETNAPGRGGSLARPCPRSQRRHDQCHGQERVARSLAELELIDEYQIVVQPFVAGAGPTLSECLPTNSRLRRVGQIELDSGDVASRYQPASPPPPGRGIGSTNSRSVSAQSLR